MGQALNLPAAGVQAAGAPCGLLEDEKPAILGIKRKIFQNLILVGLLEIDLLI